MREPVDDTYAEGYDAAAAAAAAAVAELPCCCCCCCASADGLPLSSERGPAVALFVGAVVDTPGGGARWKLRCCSTAVLPCCMVAVYVVA
jgi:hypothetical protein